MKRTLKELIEFLKDMKFDMYGDCEIEILDDTTNEFISHYYLDVEDFYDEFEREDVIIDTFKIYSFRAGKTVIEITLRENRG